MAESEIDWKVVSDKLRCPICGDKAFIEPASDGTQASHTHQFELTRQHARELCQPTQEEIEAEIASLETRLHALKCFKKG